MEVKRANLARGVAYAEPEQPHEEDLVEKARERLQRVRFHDPQNRVFQLLEL